MNVVETANTTDLLTESGFALVKNLTETDLKHRMMIIAGNLRAERVRYSMERLTTDNPVSEMGMVELAHNSCFAKDRNATYRDYDIEIDARDLIREAARSISCLCVDDCFYTDDETFDEIMLDWCQYGIEDECGRLALIYRNLWAQADLYEGLKTYEVTGLTPDQIISMDKAYREKCEEVAKLEKLEEQGRLIELPCEIGTTIYWIDLSVEPNDKGKWITRMRIKAKKFDYGVLDWIDTPIYLTREAAEKALEAMKQE